MIGKLRARLAAGAALLLCLLALPATASAASTVSAPSATAAAAEPAVALSLQEAAKGAEITVTGTGWRPGTLVMLLLCGQNMIGGTNSCANADGAAVSTGDDGRFTARLAVVAPPKPCPCVVNATSVGGDRATVATALKITDHPVAELPAEPGSPRLAMLSGVRLAGGDGILTWFGAPPGRTFTVTVGNLGPAPVKDPVFQLGTAHGVLAPLWEEVRWKGTIPPGGKAEVRLAVGLSAGAHGDYTVSLKYGDTVVAAQPWRVSRPYGVLLFWALLLVVVPAGLFRAGMAVVDRVRPHAAPTATAAAAPAAPAAATTPTTTTAVLPWFTAPQASAPSENSPTTKGQA
ncbi:neocarzinostatin apoprotein domain-containing protein [Streptomyces sp. NPDC047718]|uniref:neocarzinostatin apoprotein domain-containing protein n=1 Tax=Streptomyces sp. NPDC047718 TaxID=3155479 RepID=UPI0034070FCD